MPVTHVVLLPFMILLSAIFSQAELARDLRIVGGTLAEEDLAPYQISLQGFNPVHNCGGVIIDARWVLTAGHCAYKYLPQHLFVISGTNRYKEPGARSTIKNIHVHCNYNIPEKFNDIALLELTEPLIFNNKTQPIALPVAPLRSGEELLLTGWGRTSAEGEIEDDLRKIYLKYMPYEECDIALESIPQHDIGQICTFTREGEGSCFGDSGGPLVRNGRLYGLVNWGYPCAIGTPDVHASVYFYLDWIRRTMSGNSKC